MKRVATLLIFVLGSMVPLHAQDNSKATEQTTGKTKEMVGVICNADNVTQDEGKSTCDENKGGTSKNWVFIDEEGKATMIANPKKLKGMHGKLKVKCEMKKDPIKEMEMMWIYSVEHIPAG